MVIAPSGTGSDGRTSPGPAFLSALLSVVFLTQAVWALQQPAEEAPERHLYIVVLSESSPVGQIVSETPGAAPGDRQALLREARARTRLDRVEEQQQEFISRLSSGEAAGLAQTTRSGPVEIVARRRFLLNTVFIRASADQAGGLRNDPAVRSVHLSRPRRTFLDSAPEFVNAPVLWGQVGGAGLAGRGIKIGIIDTGINVNHPMFADTGFEMPPEFPLPEQDPNFINNKVIVARTYVDLFPNSQENRTPEDEAGHGSQVASVAAGRTVAAPLASSLSGIAPGAFLGNYKVFGTPGTNSFANSATILAALSDAVKDGMDVINLSLGGPGTDPATDPEQQAIRLASEMGVIVVIAAGNSGPFPGSIESPGTSPDAITVGAVSHLRRFSAALEIAAGPPGLGLVGYTPGSQVDIPTPLGPLPLQSVLAVDPSELACRPLAPAGLLGAAVLVRRGQCLFQTKADHVFAAGAAALIVYNNIGGEGPIMMAFGSTGPGGPAVMISNPDGEALRDFLSQGSNPAGQTAQQQASVVIGSKDDIRTLPTQPDVVTSFSSVGPSFDEIKPDLTAVGQGVYGASRTTAFTRNLNGTSFSTPMVSGAAAILRQLHPQWTASEIKSALVNSALPTPIWKGSPARVIRAGAGRLDLSTVGTLEVTAVPSNLGFGTLDEPSGDPAWTRTVRIKNHASSQTAFQTELKSSFENPSVMLQVSPDAFVLGPGEDILLEVVATLFSELTGGAFEGSLQIIDSSDNSLLRIPFWGGVLTQENPVTLSVSQTVEADFSRLDSALQSARAGDTIEVLDSATYVESLRIGLNEEGLPLKALTLRSRAPQRPVLDSVSSTGPAIEVTHVDGVVIDGFQINGPTDLVRFDHASGGILNGVLQGNDGGSGFGVSTINSEVFVLDSQFTRINKSAIASFGSAVLAQGNTLGTGSAPNSSHGFFASPGGASSLFANTITASGTGDTGQGIRISGSTALVKGNIIEGSAGAFGDGVLISGATSRALVADNVIRENSRNGVSVFSGGSATLFRNRIEGNAGPGIWAGSDTELRAEAIQVSQNRVGLLANPRAVVELSNSVLSSNQEAGLFADSATIMATNNTFWGNQRGVDIPGSAGSLFANSIIAENDVEQVRGVPEQDLFNNLISGFAPSLDHDNFAGDPRLVDPARFDFRLQPDSPAIDAGDPSRAALPTDWLGHARVSDGDGDGSAVVDIGATEFTSEYGLPIILPLFRASEQEFFGIALTNASERVQSGPSVSQVPEKGNIRWRLYSPDGSLRKEGGLTVESGTQEAQLLSELAAPASDGWLEISPDVADLVGFGLAGDFGLSRLDGAVLGPATAVTTVFPQVLRSNGRQTVFHVVNPGESPVTVQFRHFQGAGPDLQAIRDLPKRGSFKATFEELFGNRDTGYVTVSNAEQAPLVALEVFREGSSSGAFTGQDEASASDLLFGAHFGQGGGLTTQVSLVNLGPAGTTTVEVLDEKGQRLASAQRPMAGGQFWNIELNTLLPDASILHTGWIRASTDTGLLLGSLTFQTTSGSVLASLPLQARGARESIFSHVAETEELFSGVTLLNANAEATLVLLEVFDHEGRRTGRAIRRLNAGQRIALLLPEWISGFQPQAGGFVRVRSTHPVFGFELFGTRRLSLMAAVPQQVVIP